MLKNDFPVRAKNIFSLSVEERGRKEDQQGVMKSERQEVSKEDKGLENTA
jgi:hypothetical protein